MLDLRIIRDGQQLAPEALADAIGRAQAETELGSVIEHMIGLLDTLHGDPDFEATGTEDDFADHDPLDRGAGCPIADPGEDDDPLEEDDSLDDAAWLERTDQTRPALPRMRAAQKVNDGTSQSIGNVEDLEDDDADAEHDGAEPSEDFEKGADDESDCGSVDGRIDQCGWGNAANMPVAGPVYDVDQSQGPSNGRIAAFDHHARELGLVRTESGWRRRS